MKGRAFLLAATLAAGATTAGAEVPTRTANGGQVLLESVPEVPERLAGQLARYRNIRSAVLHAWTPDGSGIYVVTRFGAVDQLHLVRAPGAARSQLTFFPEPVDTALRQPGGRLLALEMDVGGSEQFQIFLFDPADGSSRRLTDGASRNRYTCWSHDGRYLAYMSTRRNGRSNDVWMMEVGRPEEARMVVESPDVSWWDTGDFSRDGRYLLVEQWTGVVDSAIHLLDLASGDLRRLAGGGEEPTVNFPARLSAGDRGVFLISDQRSDRPQLVHLSLATGELTVLTGDIPWPVDSFALSEDRRRLAFTTNEGGIGRLYFLDPVTWKHRRLDDVPTGLPSGLRFSPGGRRLGLTLESSETLGDVFSLELGDDPLDAGELVRWTRSEVGGLDTASFVEPELVSYPTFDEDRGERRRIPAFFYKPPGAGPHPVVVYLHGGPENQFRPGFHTEVQAWVRELGVAVLAPNVRGSAGYGRDYVQLDDGLRREGAVRDVGALLDWIATRPALDPGRVAVYGRSYGGYLVLASLVRYGERLRAGVDAFGISSFVTLLEQTRGYRRDMRRAEYGDERDPPVRAFLEKISPDTNAERITSPLFVAQGENDPRVPASQSERIVRDVRAAGHEVWYMKAGNEGHGFHRKENRDLYDKLVVLFLEKHLLGRGEPSGREKLP